jgi:hypothetical protein
MLLSATFGLTDLGLYTSQVKSCPSASDKQETSQHKIDSIKPYVLIELFDLIIYNCAFILIILI